MKKTSNYDARNYIAAREEFTSHTGSFSGRRHTPGRYVYTGHLPGRLAGTETVGDADYIVFSYSTPIAWHLEDGWVVPPVSYSITTAKHQGIARSATGGQHSKHHLPQPWDLGLTARAGEILESIRYGNPVTRKPGARFAPFEAVVATGEAIWTSTDTIAPAPR